MQESREKEWWNEREQAALRGFKWLKVFAVVLVAAPRAIGFYVTVLGYYYVLGTPHVKAHV